VSWTCGTEFASRSGVLGRDRSRLHLADPHLTAHLGGEVEFELAQAVAERVLARLVV